MTGRFPITFNGLQDGWRSAQRPEGLDLAWAGGMELFRVQYNRSFREAIKSAFVEQEDADALYRRQECQWFMLFLTLLKRSLPRSRASNSSNTVVPEEQSTRWFVRMPTASSGVYPHRPGSSQDTASTHMVAEWRRSVPAATLMFKPLCMLTPPLRATHVQAEEVA